MDLFFNTVRRFLTTKIKMPSSLASKMDDNSVMLMERHLKGVLKDIADSSHIILLDIDKYTEDMSDLNIELLKHTKLPFSNFFIEMQYEGRCVGIHALENKDRTLEVCVYLGERGSPNILPIYYIIDLDRLPRVYPACTQHCNKYVKTTKIAHPLNSVMCMRTERTAPNCNLGTMSMLCTQIITLVVQELNKQPKRITNKKDEIKHPVVKSNKANSDVVVKQRFIYLNKEYNAPRRGESDMPDSKGTPKCPHSRRGHYRRYKSGKMVWIKETKVKGGENEQKIYKL